MKICFVFQWDNSLGDHFLPDESLHLLVRPVLILHVALLIGGQVCAMGQPQMARHALFGELHLAVAKPA